jgi:tripartite motif-containing protein 71
VWRSFTATGTFVRQFGTAGLEAGHFSGPGGLAVDSHGNVWVADTGAARVDEWSESGTFLGQVGPTSYSSGCDPLMCLPMGVAVDSHDNLWIADYGHSRIDDFNEAGESLGHFGAFGSGEGQFEWPVAIAVDSASGDVWVPEWAGERIEEWAGAV